MNFRFLRPVGAKLSLQWMVVEISEVNQSPVLAELPVAIDDYAKDGGPGVV